MGSNSTSGQRFQRSILLSVIGMILAGCTSSSPTTSLAPDLSNPDLSASSVDISLYYEGNLQSVEPKDAAISFALIQEPPITDPAEIVDFVGTEDPTGLQIPIQLNDIDPELLDIEDSDLNGNGEIDRADTAILFWLSQGLRDSEEIIEACLVVPGIDCSFDPDTGPIDQILTLPEITSPLTAEATLGIPFAYQIVASANPTSFAVEDLPAGLSINAETGLITGVPTGPAGEVSLTISATNSNGTTPAILTLSLLADDPEQPEITSPVFASARVGDPFSYAITATNTPTTFAATGLPEGLSLDPATGLITGTPTAASLAGSPYNVTISATNASGTASTTIIVLVNPESAPQITSSLVTTASVGDPFTYSIEATGATQFDALGLPEGLSVDRQTGEISGTPTTAVGSPFQVLISATNDSSTAFEILTLTVNDPTALPVITSPTAATATLEVAFQFQITATNNPTSFGASGLPDGLNVDPITGQISGIPSGSPNIADVVISATNANGTTTANLTLTILPLNQDQPQITSPLSATASVGQAFEYQIEATNNPTSFDATGLPDELSIDQGTGLISGTPTPESLAGSPYNVTISATNANGTTSTTLTLTITAAGTPDITSPLTATAIVGEAFTYQIEASGATSFGAEGLPDGLSVSNLTGVISGTPTTAEGSPFQILISASNENGTTVETLVLTINPAVSIPEITSRSDASATIGIPFQFQITATGDPTSFEATDLPPGLSLDPVTGRISGIPTGEPGPASVNLTVTNTEGQTTGTLDLTVLPGDPITLPEITSPPIATARVDSLFEYLITATNNPTSFATDGLPSELSLTEALISGTPTTTSLTDSPFNVVIEATNADGTVSTTIVLIVNPAEAPEITSPLTATATVGEVFTYSIEASGDPTSYDAVGLPEGLSLDPVTGLITGTPTTREGSPVQILISATNASGTGIAALSLEIEQPGPPEIVSPLSVEATRGIPFTYQIVAMNEPTNYAGGPFPPELELNPETGRISGIPDIAAGMYEIPIRAFNDLGEDTVDLSLTVRELDLALAPEITSPTLVTARVGTEFIYTITATNTPTAFNLSGDLPTGLSFDPGTGQITGTPVNTTGSPFNLTLSASNENGEAITNITLLVVPAEAPLITSPLEQTFTACEPFDYLIEADNTPILEFAADPLPETLTLDPFTGEISGTIQNPEASPFQIMISATNAAGTSSQTLRVELEPGEEALVFADPLLEGAILAQVGKEADQKVFPCDVAGLTQLVTSQNRGIESLEGIQALTSLQSLFIRGNLISDLTPLSELTSLTRLFAEDNQISDLTPLSNLINLEQLFLNFNDITDLTPLSPLTNLIILQLNNNTITDLTGLETLETLIFLQINSNDIVDLAPLSSLTTLLELELSTNSIEDVTPLSNLTQLTLLSLNLNNIQNIAPLGNLVRLTNLRLADNTIVDIGPLQTLTNIENLELEDNDIVDLNPLSDLPNLIFVNLQNNQIMDIQPLVDNVNGLASGDQVFLDDNPLDDNSINVLIPALESRGVQVRFE